MTKEESQTMDIICARCGAQLTEEQRRFAYDFTRPLISFSNPGTGKSHSIVLGLIMAQTYHGVSGKMINAMSFTNIATAELKARYDKACKACSITPNVNFNTFHSICYSIVREVYPDMRIRVEYDISGDIQTLNRFMQDEGIATDDMFFVKDVLRAINDLNVRLVFDEENVKRHYVFKKLYLDDVSVFQRLRYRWFSYNLVTRNITRGDIPIYALFCLLTREAVRGKYQKKYKIMVVDEFQDMSLLNLKILATITKNLVAVGDMKQQIYGFTGASHQIVAEYKKMFPNAREVNLTQSFRCRNEIAEYATAVYHPNDHSVKPFRGVGEGGAVKCICSAELNLRGIVETIKQDQDRKEERDVLFLFRNNASATPVAEALYAAGVEFRVNNFKMVGQLPIYKELCMYADLATHPDKEEALRNIPVLFPEFRHSGYGTCPLVKAIRNSGKDLFTVKYQFSERSSMEILHVLNEVRKLVAEDKVKAFAVFQMLLPLYEEYIIQKKWYKLDMEPEFYMQLVSSIVEKKTYNRMVLEEWDKYHKIQNCCNTNIGVRCYTVHAAKGLEADDVYLLDTESVLYPSRKAMRNYANAGCAFDAAVDLRNERCLLYTAITRARDRVYITYQNELSQLITNPDSNYYTYLDRVYESELCDYDDIGAFLSLFTLNDTGEGDAGYAL